MEIYINIFEGLFGFISGMSLLFFSAPIPRYLRKRYPFLTKLDKRKGILLVLFCTSLAGFYLTRPVVEYIDSNNFQGIIN